MTRTTDSSRPALGAALDPDVWRRIAQAPQMREQVAAVVGLADGFSRAPIAEIPPEMYGDYARTGDRGAFETRYFERRRRLAALALVALLQPGSGTADLAAVIEAICEEPQWALPAHVGGGRDPVADPWLVVDLFAAETGSALAEIATLLADRLPEALVARIREQVISRVIEPYEQYTFWWEDFPNNWAAVCAGSVALAALQTCSPDRVRALLPRLRASLRRSLDGYGDDGVCVEGFGYWRYGFGYYLVATHALDAALGAEPEPGRAAEAARWPLRAFLSGDVLVPFADTWLRGRVDAGLLAGADARYGHVGAPPHALVEPEVIDECGRWALALRSLCWQVGATDQAPPAHLDRPRWYPDAQWLVVPEGGHSPIGLATRGGDNGEPHNHNDLGSVVVARAGELLVADAGRGVYDKQYFGPDRYDNPAAGSHGHSVPLLDGVRQAAGSEARAEVLAVEIGPGIETFEVDLTSAYPHPALTRLVRRVQRRGEEVTVTDRLEATRPVALTQRFVTLVPPEVADGGAHLIGEHAQAVLTWEPGAAIATGSFPVGRGSFPLPVHHLDVRWPAAERTERTVTVRTAER